MEMIMPIMNRNQFELDICFPWSPMVGVCCILFKLFSEIRKGGIFYELSYKIRR